MSLRAGLRKRLAAAAVLALSSALHLGCGANEPKASDVLQVVDQTTGWFDAGIQGGQNKIVPMLSFSVKNSGKGSVSYVSFNAVFKVIDDPEELGAALLKGIDGKGLAAGQTAGPFVGRSNLGYTSPAPRMEIFQHSQFKDAQVELFVKHRSSGWIKIGQYKIQRQLLTR